MRGPLCAFVFSLCYRCGFFSNTATMHKETKNTQTNKKICVGMPTSPNKTIFLTSQPATFRFMQACFCHDSSCVVQKMCTPGWQCTRDFWFTNTSFNNCIFFCMFQTDKECLSVWRCQYDLESPSYTQFERVMENMCTCIYTTNRDCLFNPWLQQQLHVHLLI